MEEKQSIQDVIDAIKELTEQTKNVAVELRKMKDEHEKWRKAGKF